MELTFDLGPGDERLFVDDSLEQIEAMETGLLELERGGASGAVVNEVFRAAHTLKGSAATIAHRRMAELTHALEDVFGAIRSGTVSDVGPFANTALETIDVLRDLVGEVTEGRVLTDQPPALTQRLRELLAQATGAESPGPSAGAEAAPAGGAPSPAAGPSTGDPRLDLLLATAPAPEGPRAIATCTIDPATEWRAVRMLQAVMEATESGAMISHEPSLDAIERGEDQGALYFLLSGTPEALEPVAARLRAVDDMAEVAVVAAPEAGGPPAGQPERRTANLGPEARDVPPEERLAVAGDRLKQAQQTIRIDVSRLDELMNLVGELVVQKTRLQLQAQHLLARLGDDPLAREAEEGAQQFARIASQLQDQVTGLRMLPIETVFNRFPRVVRDLAARLEKEVELVVEGGETELDRSVLEEVGDPLGHLVRNALDHGLEKPDVRAAAGKNPRGRVRLSARHADGQIVITVEDDGKGMDPGILRESAVTKGLMTPEAAAALSDAEALKIIFMPGFSMAARITDVSGRGVGMDVVRTNIERLGGRVDITSAVGTGTKISLSLPLTLAIVGAMLVRSNDRVCALPLTGVVETLRVDRGTISHVQGHPVITLRGRVVPIAVLDAALGDPARPLIAGERGFVNMVVVRSRDTELALAVDEFVGQQEIVVKSMTTFTERLAGISGATIMADGAVALVIDIAALLHEGTWRNTRAA